MVVASRNSVSCGAIFRKTTFEIEDLPLLEVKCKQNYFFGREEIANRLSPMSRRRGFCSWCPKPAGSVDPLPWNSSGTGNDLTVSSTVSVVSLLCGLLSGLSGESYVWNHVLATGANSDLIFSWTTISGQGRPS